MCHHFEDAHEDCGACLVAVDRSIEDQEAVALQELAESERLSRVSPLWWDAEPWIPPARTTCDTPAARMNQRLWEEKPDAYRQIDIDIDAATDINPLDVGERPITITASAQPDATEKQLTFLQLLIDRTGYPRRIPAGLTAAEASLAINILRERSNSRPATTRQIQYLKSLRHRVGLRTELGAITAHEASIQIASLQGSCLLDQAAS